MERMSSSSRMRGEGMVDDALVKESCCLSFKAAAAAAASPYLLCDKDASYNSSSSSSSVAFFAFPSVWSVEEWKPTSPSPSSEIPSTFPSLCRVNTRESALLHSPFLRRFLTLLSNSPFQKQVHQALAKRKQIVMTGHSSGGSVAVIATIWLLEQFRKLNDQSQLPLCITFGSPLVGDHIFGHAVRRQDWSCCFFHFVMRYDIIPRLLLTPLEAIERELQTILPFLDPKLPYSGLEAIVRSQAVLLFGTVLRNASLLASQRACQSMDCTNMLLEALPSFVKLSPFRPVGTYIFCTGNGRLLIVNNSDAVLQLFSYCLQLGPEEDLAEVAYRSLKEHLAYESELQESLAMQDIVTLDQLDKVPLSLEDARSNEMQSVEATLNDLGLSMEARVCLCAAGESEKNKLKNLEKIKANRGKIEEALNKINNYRKACKTCGIGYYDAFKLQKKQEDFNANLRRLELAGLFDEILDMLRREELPDNFESQEEWVNLGTHYRCLVEPLDIANYYRHYKNEDTGPYLITGRPRRYKCTQRWLAHARGVPAGSITDSCFWAKVEELSLDTANGKCFDEMSGRIMELEKELAAAITSGGGGALDRDVLLEGSTFVRWWKTLPQQHQLGSCIAGLIYGEGRNPSSMLY